MAAKRLTAEAYSNGRAIIGQSTPVQISGLITVAALMACPELANAQVVNGGASPATMINNICTFILGPFGQSLAVLGIIAIGLSWMFGRVSLGLIAGVIGGIVIMFGASYLGSTLTGGGGG
jgi:type IV secretory pathway VirB2 component (pilin)